ncbi:MAG: type VII toxin-antitoxin system MntA family adenylyltransferase antitoxin [Gemmatimonadota bacterium]
MANPERWKRFADLPEDLGARLGHLPALFEKRGVLLAYLFGSLAADDPSPGDVDLAVLTAVEPAHTFRADLQRALGTQRLDLVDLRTASPLLRFHVVRDGRLLYARDDETLNRFELDTLHLYRDTAPLRRRHREILRERMDAWS